MSPEELIEVAKEIVAIDDARDAHMKKWPEWWQEGSKSFEPEMIGREPNLEWRALTERRMDVEARLVVTARSILAEASDTSSEESKP